MLLKSYGLAFRERREASGIRQGDVAEAAGVARPMLSEMETGKRVCDQATYQRLIAALESCVAERDAAYETMRG